MKEAPMRGALVVVLTLVPLLSGCDRSAEPTGTLYTTPSLSLACPAISTAISLDCQAASSSECWLPGRLPVSPIS